MQNNITILWEISGKHWCWMSQNHQRPYYWVFFCLVGKSRYEAVEVSNFIFWFFSAGQLKKCLLIAYCWNTGCTAPVEPWSILQYRSLSCWACDYESIAFLKYFPFRCVFVSILLIRFPSVFPFSFFLFKVLFWVLRPGSSVKPIDRTWDLWILLVTASCIFLLTVFQAEVFRIWLPLVPVWGFLLFYASSSVAHFCQIVQFSVFEAHLEVFLLFVDIIFIGLVSAWGVTTQDSGFHLLVGSFSLPASLFRRFWATTLLRGQETASS